MKMIITVLEDGTLQLEEVFSGISLKTRSGEVMGICMRDSGFEFNYEGNWYSAQNGKVESIKTSVRGNVLVDQEQIVVECKDGPSSNKSEA